MSCCHCVILLEVMVGMVKALVINFNGKQGRLLVQFIVLWYILSKHAAPPGNTKYTMPLMSL